MALDNYPVPCYIFQHSNGICYCRLQFCYYPDFPGSWANRPIFSQLNEIEKSWCL